MPSLEDVRRHHRTMLAQLEKDTEAILSGGTIDLKGMVSFLRQELLPHAAGEEHALYPAVEPLLKSHGRATATMSVDHEAIGALVDNIEKAVAEVEASGRRPGSSSANERLQRIALELRAILRLHLEKEERIYLPLLERYLSGEQQSDLMESMHQGAEASQNAKEVDVRELPPPRRHPLILSTFEALEPGQTFVLVNDHDPRPLYYQFQAELTGTFTWQYLERGPEVWRVRIGKTTPGG